MEFQKVGFRVNQKSFLGHDTQNSNNLHKVKYFQIALRYNFKTASR